MQKTIIVLMALAPMLAAAQDLESKFPDNMAGAQFGTLIDMPTAGALTKGQYDFELRAYPEGGILSGFTVGLFDRLNFGVFYGGTGIIGNTSDIDWNDEPGVVIKYRLFEESYHFPALSLGYSSQGYGGLLDNDSTGNRRYLIKSRGLYGAFSKNFVYKDNHDFSVHLGANYNTAERDDDQGLNVFCGFDFMMNEEISLIGEYDFALDDQQDKSFGESKGYLNSAVRWTFAKHLLLQVNFKDLLGNYRESATVNRELMIVYRQDI